MKPLHAKGCVGFLLVLCCMQLQCISSSARIKDGCPMYSIRLCVGNNCLCYKRCTSQDDCAAMELCYDIQSSADRACVPRYNSKEKQHTDQEAKQAVKKLLPFLLHVSNTKRESTVYQLAMYSNKPGAMRQAVPALIFMLQKDPSHKLRQIVAQILGTLAVELQLTLPGLLRAKLDPVPEVSYASRLALRKIGVKSIPVLQKLLSHEDRILQLLAIKQCARRHIA